MGTQIVDLGSVICYAVWDAGKKRKLEQRPPTSGYK